MSLAIEICQLFNLRATDIDDLMMNTLGALVGYCCWKVFSLIFRNAGTKCMEIKKKRTCNLYVWRNSWIISSV